MTRPTVARIDGALVASIVQHKTYVMPNLAPEWTTYGELPHWLQSGDPLMTLLQGTAPPEVIERMKKNFVNSDPAAVARARASYGILQRSLARLAPISSWGQTQASKIICSGWRNNVSSKA